jgi:formiminotetrahydrofolate cyclodeaminase
MNVMINVSGVADAARAAQFQKEGKRLIEECETLGNDAYGALLVSIGG